MCLKICKKRIFEVCLTYRHLKKNIFNKNEKISNFFISAQAGPGRPRACFRAGPRPASIFEEFGNCLSVKCKKWFLRKIESVYKKSGLTKIEIMFLKYHITKRKVIWLHIRFGFQISNFRQAGPRPASAQSWLKVKIRIFQQMWLRTLAAIMIIWCDASRYTELTNLDVERRELFSRSGYFSLQSGYISGPRWKNLNFFHFC